MATFGPIAPVRINPLLDLASIDRAAQGYQRNALALETAQREMRQVGPSVARALGAEPFSEEALRQALQAGRERWRTFSESYENSLAKATAAISPEGRRRLLADLPENHE